MGWAEYRYPMDGLYLAAWPPNCKMARTERWQGPVLSLPDPQPGKPLFWVCTAGYLSADENYKGQKMRSRNLFVKNQYRGLNIFDKIIGLWESLAMLGMLMWWSTTVWWGLDKTDVLKSLGFSVFDFNWANMTSLPAPVWRRLGN